MIEDNNVIEVSREEFIKRGEENKKFDNAVIMDEFTAHKISIEDRKRYFEGIEKIKFQLKKDKIYELKSYTSSLESFTIDEKQNVFQFELLYSYNKNPPMVVTIIGKYEKDGFGKYEDWNLVLQVNKIIGQKYQIMKIMNDLSVNTIGKAFVKLTRMVFDEINAYENW